MLFDLYKKRAQGQPIKAWMCFLLLMCATTSSWALDTRVHWSGSYRLRGLMQDNFAQSESNLGDAYFHRLIVGGKMEPNDSIRLLFAANLYQGIGGDYKRGEMGLTAAQDEEGQFQLAHAYGDWNLGSSFYLHFGRLDLNWGNEALVSRNSDDQRLYSFDGLDFGYDSASFKVSAGVLRVGEWASQTTASTFDSNESAYFARLVLKSFFSFVDSVEGYFFRLQSDDFSQDGITLVGSSVNRLGFTLKTSYQNLFLNADFVNLQGSLNSSEKLASSMLDLEGGVLWGDQVKKGISLVYHTDSGDDSSTGDTVETYRPLYYNHHKYAGLMDVFAWGNLTYYGVKFNVSFWDKNDFMLQTLIMGRSEKSLGPRPINYFGYGLEQDFINEDVSKNTAGVRDNSLGLEVDFVYKRKFTSKAYVEFIAGVFAPGSYMEAYGRNKTLYALRLTTGFKF